MFRKQASVVFHHQYASLRSITSSKFRSYIAKPCQTSAILNETQDQSLLFDYWNEAPLFPNLPNSYTPSLIIGIDPDVNGAIACLRFTNIASPHLDATAASIEIHDMPTETWKMKSRDKKYPSPQGILSLLQTIKSKELTSNTSIHAVLEFTTPTHLSGKFAWYGSGYANGLLDGLFLTQDIVSERISAKLWKKGLGLTKLGKEGSLILARQAYPQAAQFLT